jgi:poly(ADP-ribose) glycohydrolase
MSIILPWEAKNWAKTKEILLDPITSIVDMDSRISILNRNLLKPRTISELFNKYFTDDEYSNDRITQEHFINNVIPMMQSLILGGRKLFRETKLFPLISGSSGNITLTRRQVATLLSCAWFGLFNYKYIVGRDIDDFPEMTLINMFVEQNMFALQCFLTYFNKIHSYINNKTHVFESGIIIISRHRINFPPRWEAVDSPITEILIGEGNVDDSPAKLQVAYCEDYIGGDLFKDPLNQGDLTLLIRTESLVSLLFCERIPANESINVFGCEKFIHYNGYGSGVRFISKFVDDVKYGKSKNNEFMAKYSIIFIDASPKTSTTDQMITEFDRDLNKAYCGFSSLQFSRPENLSSGNWSYRFRGCNMQVKFIQQVLAASYANKCLVYHPNNNDFEKQVIPFIEWIMDNKLTIGDLYVSYLSAIKNCFSEKSSRNNIDIFARIMDEY